eukprot:TRINITY_DN1206_c3_g1_i1.p1 TRINITY_DN1206_c3_g1~~TRINITY_DN1206_c3_g1_i1.p1  ORF type:complete len:389 (+),score=51.62 TRINITY_DN1206_c3_g1_i1:48-1214(+)
MTSRRYLDKLRETLKEVYTPIGRGRNTVAIVGICSDVNSSFMRGPAGAPDRIREAFFSDSGNNCTELGKEIVIRDVMQHYKSQDMATMLKDEQDGKSPYSYNVIDLGNLEFDKEEEQDPQIFHDRIIELASILNSKNIAPITLGGDHAITYPLFKGLVTTARKHLGTCDSGDSVGGEWLTEGDSDETKTQRPGILHFDAHPDLYPDFEGNPYSHASPFARIAELNLAEKITQIGVRCPSQSQTAFARDYPAIDQIPMSEIHCTTPSELTQLIAKGIPTSLSHMSRVRTYVSVDVDCLDPAYAPGVSHHEPGGMSVRQLLHCIQNLPAYTPVGFDIVEYNPDRDRDGVTAMVCAKILKEAIAVTSIRAARTATIHTQKTKRRARMAVET